MLNKTYDHIDPTKPQLPSVIANYCHGRDNNFNLIRIIAATLVILTHAFGLAGYGDAEPLKATFDISLGSWAVNVFFVSSGFLIFKSWESGKCVTKFIWSRFTRIYPALWVCVLICVFCIGLVFTTLPSSEFLLHPDTLKFLAKNLTLVKGTFTSLPGTFEQHNSGVNLSLWTLPYELKMYLSVLLLGWFGWLAVRAVVPAILLAGLALHAWSIFTGSTGEVWSEYARFVYFFYAGGYLYLMAAAIPLRPSIVFVAVTLLVASMLIVDIRVRTMLLSILTPYLVIYCAYKPGGILRAYNKLGDYSYGLYIYGAPVQHVVIAIGGGFFTVFENFILTLGFSLAIAILSWHLLESRALRWPMPRLLKVVQAKLTVQAASVYLLFRVMSGASIVH